MLFSLLRMGICGGKIDETIKNNINEENLEKLFDLAKKHDVANIVADVLFKEKLMPDCNAAGLYQYCSVMALVRYQQLTLELKQMCSLFEENKIPHLPLKGAVIREFYPEPWYRTSCDVDILVKPEDLQTAADLLVEKLGYEISSKASHDWGFFTPEGIHIELHFDLIEGSDISKTRERHKWDTGYFEKVWQIASPAEGHSYKYKMPDEMFYCYHIAHMAKHFEHGGCGIRAFIDLWILNNVIKYDKDVASKIIEECRLTNFEDVCTRLCDIWFSGAEYDNAARITEEFILRGGVFGNKENLIAIEQSKKGGKIRYIISRLFIPYELLKYQFPVIKKHRWLMPLCQVCRWIKLVFKGKAVSSVNEFKMSTGMTEEDKNKIALLMDNLGL